ncbi:MAG: hypothetical protein ABI668_10430 [Sphingorhabdus sp.]
MVIVVALGDFLTLLFTILFFGWLFVAAFRRKRMREGQVEDGPADEPYKIYTTEFDSELDATDVYNRLSSLSPDSAKGYFHHSKAEWNAQLERAQGIFDEIDYQRVFSTLELRATAILILVDQSGSMKGEPMAWTAASLRHLTRGLSAAGAAVELAGFTTAGWHGGFARQKWIADKRPKRPGRLCSLLHIHYKKFDEGEWSDESWRAMLNPNLLRENVDGESILWAKEKLRKRPEAKKLLVVISDGAPVDDSTINENGPSYMWRHWQKVVAEIEAQNEMEIAAIGLDWRVDDTYSQSIVVKVGEDFLEGAAALLGGKA